jgi:hypothetical protein
MITTMNAQTASALPPSPKIMGIATVPVGLPQAPAGNPSSPSCPKKLDGSPLSSNTNAFGNSTLTSINSFAQCIAGDLFLTRGYLQNVFLDPRVRMSGAVYDRGLAGAEYIAQARAIRYINDMGITVTGDPGTVTVLASDAKTTEGGFY